MRRWPSLALGVALAFAALGVAGIWFSAGPERAATSATRTTIWPARTVFERGRDATVFMVFQFTARETARIDGKISREGRQFREFRTALRPRVRGSGSGRTHTQALPVAELPAGRYLVDVTIDGRVAGAYSFEVR
jgi:hypothetical protein